MRQLHNMSLMKEQIHYTLSTVNINDSERILSDTQIYNLSTINNINNNLMTLREL